MARKPADPEEELRWMSQEVRGYVEAVLNSLAANVPKVSTCSFSRFFEPCDLWSNVYCLFQAIVLCQVEKSKEDMLNQLYSSIRLGTPFSILCFQNLRYWMSTRIKKAMKQREREEIMTMLSLFTLET